MRQDRARALVLLAPALLMAVAGLQLWRAHTLDQSSWSGGGFGMFATFDNEDTRSVQVRLRTADGVEVVRLTGPLGERAQDLQVVPSQARTEDLAEDLAAAMAQRNSKRGDGAVTAVEVRVVGIRFARGQAGRDPSISTYVLARALARVPS